MYFDKTIYQDRYRFNVVFDGVNVDPFSVSITESTLSKINNKYSLECTFYLDENNVIEDQILFGTFTEATLNVKNSEMKVTRSYKLSGIKVYNWSVKRSVDGNVATRMCVTFSVEHVGIK